MVAGEVALGKASNSGGSSPLDCAHGAGESDLGRGACSGGAVGEAGDPGIGPDGAGVLAARQRSEGRSENLLTALEKLRPESRQGHGGRRFPGGDHGRVPGVVCLGGHGSEPHSAL